MTNAIFYLMYAYFWIIIKLSIVHIIMVAILIIMLIITNEQNKKTGKAKA